MVFRLKSNDITQVYSHNKVSQPFEALPSFAVAAEMLSYVNHAEGVKFILFRLSTTTRMYYIGHCKILQTFLIERPPLIKNPMFGEHPDPCEEEFEPDLVSNFEFPSPEQMDLINNISIESGVPHSLKFLSIK